MANKIEIRNKKASHDYEFLERLVAGICLAGTEIKSLRDGKGSLVDSYCFFVNHELYVKMQISEYRFGTYANHEARRDRKLLLKRRELNKLEDKGKDKGLTIIPLKIFLNEKGFAKMEIALCRGKREYDKREDLKDKEAKRELDRQYKM